MQIFGKKIPFSASLLLWFLLWELAGRMGLSSIFPPISKILMAATTVFTTDKFIKAMEISLRTFAAGMSLALVVGIGLGTLMARVKIVREILGMWVNIFVSAPISALVPVLMADPRHRRGHRRGRRFFFLPFSSSSSTQQIGISRRTDRLSKWRVALVRGRTKCIRRYSFLCALPRRFLPACVWGQSAA